MGGERATTYGPANAADKPWWRYDEIADRIGYSVDTVELIIKRGDLAYVQLLPGKRGRRIAGAELARWERSRVEATAKVLHQDPQPEPRRKGKTLRELLAS